jgi:hypothetical protein
MERAIFHEGFIGYFRAIIPFMHNDETTDDA